MNMGQEYQECGQVQFSCFDQSCSRLPEDSYCMPRKPKQMYDDEPGIAAKLRAEERTNNILSSATDEYSMGLDTVTPPIGVDCCHNEEFHGRRKFTVSFGVGSVAVSDECLSAQRSRCEAFWKFVDSQPELLEMIKDGEYEVAQPPKIIVEPTDRMKESKSCPEGEALRAKHQALHGADKERIFKRKMMMAELQAKSGQPIVQAQKPEKPKKKQEIGYTGCDNVSEIFQEMKLFDKMTKNPVRIGPRSPGEIDTPPPSVANWEEEGEVDDYIVQDATTM